MPICPKCYGWMIVDIKETRANPSKIKWECKDCGYVAYLPGWGKYVGESEDKESQTMSKKEQLIESVKEKWKQLNEFRRKKEFQLHKNAVEFLNKIRRTKNE